MSSAIVCAIPCAVTAHIVSARHMWACAHRRLPTDREEVFAVSVLLAREFVPRYYAIAQSRQRRPHTIRPRPLSPPDPVALR